MTRKIPVAEGYLASLDCLRTHVKECAELLATTTSDAGARGGHCTTSNFPWDHPPSCTGQPYHLLGELQSCVDAFWRHLAFVWSP